ncbi:MAG: XRE family transcriptional regulator [Ruminococcaceae bacterium]|nr:XRE family transcriptional regulator [Oscillospiraceae bacterium]
MARVSTKENKNIYQTTREGLQLSREAASELLECIAPERIEKIENERSLPHPDEVLVMAEKYKQPSLCNHYCANQCPIGQQYVPEVKIKDLSQIVLEMLASLNAMNRQKERLIEITVDGRVTGDELRDFVYIQEELERISIAVETLQLWSEQMLATGAIDEEQYHALKGE